jgi:hypothetical protein
MISTLTEIHVIDWRLPKRMSAAAPQETKVPTGKQKKDVGYQFSPMK